MQIPTGSPLSIRLARCADVQELCTLVNSAYRGDSGRRGWTTESDLIAGQRISEDLLVEILSAEASDVLIAEGESGEIHGCVHVKKESTSHSYLGMLTTNPDRQSSGVGSLLLRAAESHARHKFGALFMEMTVISVRRDLISWYFKRGYEETGETRPFPYGDPRFGVPLRGDLKFNVLRARLTP